MLDAFETASGQEIIKLIKASPSKSCELDPASTWLVKECVQVARANEISLGWQFYPYSMEYMRKAGNHKPSMLMDIENNRRTEVDAINGKFIDYGAQAGIETPYNNTLRALVKGLESR